MRTPIRTPYPLRKKAALPPLARGVALDFSDVASLIKSLESTKERMEEVIADAASVREVAVDAIEQAKKAQESHAERILEQAARVQRGYPGKAGNDAVVDYDLIVKEVVKHFRQPKDGVSPEIDYPKIIKSAAALIKVRDGNDAVVDYEKLTKMTLTALKKDLKIEHIPGLKAELDSFSRQVAGKIYGKDTWARGGGDTVVAGENITITTNRDGQKIITALGGISGTNVTTQYSLTAVQAGSDVTIDLTQLANWATFVSLVQLQRNNIPQTETVNFTIVGPTITVFGADAAEIFNVVYAYS